MLDPRRWIKNNHTDTIRACNSIVLRDPSTFHSQYDSGDKTEKKKKKKKPKEEEGTAWWEWCLIFAVLSYKIYTPLPEPIEDRYSRSVALFLNKAVYKVGHFIRIVSPSTETAYLEAAWGGISNLNNHPVEGVTDTELDLDEFKLFFFTPGARKNLATDHHPKNIKSQDTRGSLRWLKKSSKEVWSREGICM